MDKLTGEALKMAVGNVEQRLSFMDLNTGYHPGMEVAAPCAAGPRSDRKFEI